jgi:hypothetical protein
VNLSKLIFSRQAEVLSFLVSKPRIAALVNSQGIANYMIFSEPDTLRAVPPDTAAGIEVSIKKYEISDGRILYVNDSTDMVLMVEGLNHEGKGNFKEAVFTLSTETDIKELNLAMGGMSYLNDARLTMKADLEIDQNQNRFTFKENEIRLNDLTLKFDGWVKVAEDTTEINMTFGAPKTEFKGILSMIPAIYRTNFESLRAEGQMTLDGRVEGIYSKDRFPKLDVRLFVEKGMFQYTDLPTPIKNVEVNLQVTNPGMTMNETVIDLRRFHVEMGDQPFDAQLLVRNPVRDPYVDGMVKGNVDLSEVRNFMPLGDTIKLDGRISSDLTFRGNMSSVEGQKYNNIMANGSVAFSNIKYEAPSLPVPVEVPAGNISLTPQQARLERFETRFGKSDLKANGALSNFIGYILGGQTMRGTLTVTSNYLDLNPFIQEESGAIAAVELPARIDFVMSGRFEQIVVSNFNLTNVEGQLILRDRKLNLVNLSGDFLDGEIVSNGTYSYIRPGNPHVDFNLKLDRLSIPEMYKTFVTMQAFAPMAGFMKGTMGGAVKMDSDLGDSLKPIWQTLSSEGALQIPEARIEGFAPLQKVADALKLEQLRNPGISNFAPSYEVDDGVFSLNPTTLKVAGFETVLSGSNNVDGSIDYVMKLQLPAQAVKENVNSALTNIIGKDISSLTNETVVIDVGLTGTFKDPKVQTSLSQIAKGAGEQLKREAEAEAERRRQQLEEEARKKIEEQQKVVEDTVKKSLEEEAKKRIKGLFGD